MDSMLCKAFLLDFFCLGLSHWFIALTTINIWCAIISKQLTNMTHYCLIYAKRNCTSFEAGKKCFITHLHIFHMNQRVQLWMKWLQAPKKTVSIKWSGGCNLFSSIWTLELVTSSHDIQQVRQCLLFLSFRYKFRKIQFFNVSCEK